MSGPTPVSSSGSDASKAGYRALTSDAAQQKGEIEAHATEAFRFLESSAEATRSAEVGADRSLIAYVLPEAFVEIELDWEEWAAFVLVGQLVDGHRPDGYYVDSAGRKVRWQLGAVLEEGGHAERALNLKLLVRNSGPTAMIEQIDAYASELLALQPSLAALLRQLRSA